jgi:hypothetical protein
MTYNDGETEDDYTHPSCMPLLVLLAGMLVLFALLMLAGGVHF